MDQIVALPGVKPVKNGESISVLVDGAIVCSMSSGSCHRFRTENQAVYFGNQYKRGFTGGSYTDPDASNFIN